MLLFAIIGLAAAFAIALLLEYTVMQSDRNIRFFKVRMPLREFLPRALSLFLFVLFSVARLFRENAIHNQLGLDAENALMPAGQTVAATVACWLSLLTVAMAVLLPFFQKRELSDFMAFFAPLSICFTLLFYRETCTAISGNPDPLHWENLLFAAELFVTAVLAFSSLLSAIRHPATLSPAKRAVHGVGFLLTYLVPFMPAWVPGVLLGAVGDEPKDFTVEHRLLMYLAFFVVIYFYLAYRNKPHAERLFALIALALSAFLSYFSIDRTALSMLPLHLCNTAIVITLVTYIFRLQGLFYFAYLVNVLGAVFAIIMPDTYVLVSEPKAILYWFDHIYAFSLPLLGVALGIFPRPKFKTVKKAIYVFSAYVVLIALVDGWFNHASFNESGELIDYFFLYSTFFLDKFPFAVPLYKPWDLYIGGQLIRLYPLYQLTIWAVFVLAMFGLWGIYAILYRVADDHKELAAKKAMRRERRRRLAMDMQGRPLTEPLNPDGRGTVKVNHFTKVYRGSKRKAADDVTLEAHAGEVFGFIGHNGAGKSTTIKSLVGIQSITEGSIEIEGYDISRQPTEAKQNIGYVSDNHAVYEDLTGREYIHYVADLYRVSPEDCEARLAKYAAIFKIEEALDREIKGYSHGMKQKVMVISSLIHAPKVWVLDEPLTGLDPTSSYQIKKCMREHANEGNIVFFSSHMIEVVERMCDRIAIIADGKLCDCETIEEIRASGRTLEDIYLGYALKPEGEEGTTV